MSKFSAFMGPFMTLHHAQSNLYVISCRKVKGCQVKSFTEVLGLYNTVKSVHCMPPKSQEQWFRWTPSFLCSMIKKQRTNYGIFSVSFSQQIRLTVSGSSLSKWVSELTRDWWLLMMFVFPRLIVGCLLSIPNSFARWK